jgi:hypothetical protein
MHTCLLRATCTILLDENKLLFEQNNEKVARLPTRSTVAGNEVIDPLSEIEALAGILAAIKVYISQCQAIRCPMPYSIDAAPPVSEMLGIWSRSLETLESSSHRNVLWELLGLFSREM